MVVAGELEVSTCSRVRQTLEELATNATVAHVVLDLRGVRFLDSAGLQTIVRADAAARRDGHNLALVKAPPSVHRVFVLSGLDTQMVIVDDPEELAPPGDRTKARR